MKKDLIALNRKEEICAALKRLLARKSIQKITIQELADECGISRYTFYYHFTDIYDCLSWMLQEHIRSSLCDLELGCSWEAAVKPFLQSINENKAIYKQMRNSSHLDLLHRIFHQEVKPLVEMHLSAHLKESQYQASEDYLSFLTNFVTSALEGILVIWAQLDPNPEDELLTSYLHTVLGERADSIFRQAEQRGFCTKVDVRPSNPPADTQTPWNHLL